MSVAAHSPVRPYGVGFVVPIALMTLVGGKRTGFLTLGLSLICLVCFLFPPQESIYIVRAVDATESILLLCIGAMQVLCVDAMQRATASAQTAREQAESNLVVAAERAKFDALLNHVSQAIRGYLDAGSVQSNALRSLGEGIEADRCCFLVYDINSRYARIESAWRGPGVSAPSMNGHGKEADCDLRSLFWDGNTQVITDVETAGLPEIVKAELGRLRMRSLIAVPIMDGGQVIAALIVSAERGPREWTRHEVWLAQEVTTLTRSAVEMARVHQRERKIAETLQGTVQPLPPDHVAGLDIASYYKPALDEAKVGGDFSDVFAIEKGCYALVVGDLSGKGLDAAAQVSTVRNMLRYALYSRAKLTTAITELNGVLVTNDLLSGFATLVVLAYDVNAQTVTYVSCGQEPALIRRTAEGLVEQLPPTGPVLGAMENAVYEERVLPLRAGDAFVLYTDGITESGPTRTELLGVSGLISLLVEGSQTASALLKDIIAGASEHANGVFLDDVCMLVGIAVDERYAA